MPQVEHIGMFTTVDALDDPGVFIGLLDRIQDVSDVQAIRKGLLDRLELRPGESESLGLRVAIVGEGRAGRCLRRDRAEQLGPLLGPLCIDIARS